MFMFLMRIRLVAFFVSPRSSVGLERRTYIQYRSNAKVVSSSLTGGINTFFYSAFCVLFCLVMSHSYFTTNLFPYSTVYKADATLTFSFHS